MNALTVVNLSKDYGGFELRDVSFALPKGAIMGLIGENGAGKSTTIGLILNLMRKDKGEVSVFGLEHSIHDREIKKQTGIVLDENVFHDALNAEHISRVMRRIYENWDERKFFSCLKNFGVPEKKTVKELSRGMKMKLSIAAALSHDPKLLILDEATSGLDPVSRNEILDILLDFIQDPEKAVLISSHITSDLEKICDMITFIHNGEIIFSEEKDTLLERYGILRCGTEEFDSVDKSGIIGCRKGKFGVEALVRDKLKAQREYRGFVIDGAGIEDIMLFYARGGRS